MSTKECCKTCQHCCAGQTTFDGWCRLRQIKVHSEIAPFAFCHHWTKRAPSLPRVPENLTDTAMERQLELGRALVSTEK